MAESSSLEASIQRFRAYGIRRMIDVRVAAAAIQREDLFPAIDSQIRHDLSTIVLELGTNIVKYAGSGRILLRSFSSEASEGIEVLAIDEGPGISNLAQAMEDHFTTGRTLGLGLGSVRRLASEFELECPESGGTRVRALRWWQAVPESAGGSARAVLPVVSSRLQAPQAAAAPMLQLSTIERNRPALHEPQSGDGVLVVDHGHLGVRVVLDGTGHGPVAHRIACQAAAAIREDLEQQLADMPLDGDGSLVISETGIIALMLSATNAAHTRIRGSRGAALGLAVFDRCCRRVHFLGIGNTRILLLGLRGWEGVSRDGQLGVAFKKPVISHFPLEPGDVVLQASDGIRTATLRSMRPRRRGVAIDLEQVAGELLTLTTLADDVSLLLTRCHV